VLRIASCWQISDADIAVMLGVSAPTVRRWKQQMRRGNLRIRSSVELPERLSLISGIYKNLQILFDSTSQADGWLKRANTSEVFNGRSALEFVLDGRVESLRQLRRHLDVTVWAL